jgi:hypothetical protein
MPNPLVMKTDVQIVQCSELQKSSSMKINISEIARKAHLAENAEYTCKSSFHSERS